jgi:hypothetical protein
MSKTNSIALNFFDFSRDPYFFFLGLLQSKASKLLTR